jgi:acyl carrier protein
VMSCRAMGRGVIGGLLAWLTRYAARAGAPEIAVPCVLNERNVPLRVALTGAGFRAGAGPGPATVAVFRRGTGTALPELPSWLRAPGEADAPIAAELRQMLARITGRDELAGLPVDAPLFGDAVALDSLTGTLLLREIQQRFGVDVAGLDLNLDALATVGTLASFIAGQGG